MSPKSRIYVHQSTKCGFSKKAFRRQNFFLFPYVLLACYHHLRVKLGMYISQCVFLNFWQVCNFLIFLKSILQIKATSVKLADVSLKSTRSKIYEDRITKMALIIVGTFVLCNTLQVIYYAYVTLIGVAYSRYIMLLISSLFIAINSSFNAVIYGIFSKKYRKVFLKYFWFKKARQPKLTIKLANSSTWYLTMYILLLKILEL